MESDRGHALRDAIMACRPGGIVSVIGVYGGLVDKFPAGAFMNKGLTMKTGQCHVQRYLQPLYERIRKGDIDPSFVVTHRLAAGGGAQWLRDVQAQAGRLREGGAQAMSESLSGGFRRPVDATLHGVVDYTAGATLLTAFPAPAGIEGSAPRARSGPRGDPRRVQHADRLPARGREAAPVPGAPRARRVGALALAATPFVTGQYGKDAAVGAARRAVPVRARLAGRHRPDRPRDYHGDVEAVRRANTEDPPQDPRRPTGRHAGGRGRGRLSSAAARASALWAGASARARPPRRTHGSSRRFMPRSSASIRSQPRHWLGRASRRAGRAARGARPRRSGVHAHQQAALATGGDRHVAADQERQPAEHPLLGDVGLGGTAHGCGSPGLRRTPCRG